MSHVELKIEGDKLVVKTPYLKVFLDEFKSAIPVKERKYDPSSKTWIVTLNNKSIVERLVAKYFSELEEVLLVAISEDTPPRFGGAYVVNFDRDRYRGISKDLVHVVKAVRVGDTGSRKYPRWSGYVLARILVNSNIPIEAKYYRLFRFTPEALESLQDFVERLAEKYGDDLDGAAEELKNLDIEEHVLNSELNVSGTVLETLSEYVSELERLVAEYAAAGAGNPDSLNKILQKVKKSLEFELKRVETLLERINS